MALAGGVSCIPTRGDDLGIIQGNPIPAEAPSGCPQGRGELGFLFAHGATVLPVGGVMGEDFSGAMGLQGSLFPWGESDPTSLRGVTRVGGRPQLCWDWDRGLAAAFQTLHGNRLPDAGI